MKRRRRLRWSLPFICGAAVQLPVIVVQLLAGDPLQAAVPAIYALCVLLYAVIVRNEFRRGWSRGFFEGVVLNRDARMGRLPDALVRQEVTGRAEPEPWDEFPAPWDIPTTKG